MFNALIVLGVLLDQRASIVASRNLSNSVEIWSSVDRSDFVTFDQSTGDVSQLDATCATLKSFRISLSSRISGITDSGHLQVQELATNIPLGGTNTPPPWPTRLLTTEISNGARINRVGRRALIEWREAPQWIEGIADGERLVFDAKSQALLAASINRDTPSLRSYSLATKSWTASVPFTYKGRQLRPSPLRQAVAWDARDCIVCFVSEESFESKVTKDLPWLSSSTSNPDKDQLWEDKCVLVKVNTLTGETVPLARALILISKGALPTMDERNIACLGKGAFVAVAVGKRLVVIKMLPN